MGELSKYASDKCKERVELVDSDDKSFCINPKDMRGVALCTSYALLASGEVTNKSEALREGWRRTKQICHE